ncbi:MAG TPA: hypothetical protein VG500_11740 [Gemmatimonadales bacterium]|jgi:hypothetical protein|nr:hypothetical protein [Gemmatimonadales bacterium]
MPPFRRVLPLLALSVLAACGDDDNLPEPTERNFVDTVTVGSLTDTPITTASGFAVTVGPIRTDLDPSFDFAYDIRGTPDTGRSVLLPRAVLGITSGGTAEPGLMRRDEAFDAIEVAPSNGYVTEEEVPIAVGERYIVRSRVTCALSVPYYAKIEILGLEDNSVILKVLANRNCGYRGLEPGFPDR